ncbi:hypothetical protein EON63_09000 [archaeon]|nr:MAG: hypothetical protein EON63_09000 [archaeon]
MGLLTVRWLRSANRPLEESDVTMQIAMTFCSAYITFFLAQNTFEISGKCMCIRVYVSAYLYVYLYVRIDVCMFMCMCL